MRSSEGKLLLLLLFTSPSLLQVWGRKTSLVFGGDRWRSSDFHIRVERDARNCDFEKTEEEEASEQVLVNSQVGVSFHHLTNGFPLRRVSAHSPPPSSSSPSPSSRPHASKSPSLCFALCSLTLLPAARRRVPPVAPRVCACECAYARVCCCGGGRVGI